MILEIWKDGINLDLYSDTNIRYVLQVNDIAELKDRQASYTTSFSIPKTPRNVHAFDGLGIPSDTSKVPYVKPDCKMKSEGFDVIKKGWLNVKNSDDEYSCYLNSGLFNFFKTIENKTLGNDLDLSEINHIKDIGSVAASYSPGSPFRYFLADYNGQTHFLDDPTIINIDYLIPSVNVKYLWDKLHSEFNFPYLGDFFDSDDLKSLWFTYPKAPNIADLYKLISSGTNTQRYNVPNAQGENYVNQHMRLFVNNIDPGSVVWRNGQFLDIAENGVYRITFEVSTVNSAGGGDPYGILNYWLAFNSEGISPENITNKINIVTTSVNTTAYREFLYPLSAGTVLNLFFKKDFMGGAIWIDMTFKIKIEKVNKENVNFQDGLADFLITDFVKEVLNNGAITIFPTENSNQLTYKTISERVRTGNVIDWSDKYIERTDEEYVSTDYGQRNFFQYQYNDKEGSYYDGYIDVSNMNIPATKQIFKSKMYAPERIKTKFKINDTTEIDTDVFKFYEKQVSDNPAKPPSYKGLEKRFYFIKQAEGTYSATIGSDATNETTTVTNAVVGNFSGLDWQSIIGKNYGDFVTILNDSRLHTIDLDLDIIDIIQLDFTSLYYFRQEQQNYLLNKVNFDNNKSTGEFIRVKKSVEYNPINVNVTISWIDGNINTTSTWNHYVAVASLTGNPTFVWQKRLNNGSWEDVANDVIEYDYQFPFGKNDLRASYTNGLVTGISNVLSYERKIEENPDRCYEFYFTSLQALPRTIDYVGVDGLITSKVLNFSSPEDVKILEAKAITSAGGATIINQKIISCPPIQCIKYYTSKFAGSGDSLAILYVDCQGNTIQDIQYGTGTGQWLEYTVCAVEGSFYSNSNVVDLGPC